MIRESQRRVTIVMEKTDYELLERAARDDRRSVSNYCNMIILKHLYPPRSMRGLKKAMDAVDGTAGIPKK